MDDLIPYFDPPSIANWNYICEKLDQIEDLKELSRVLAICEKGIQNWPDYLRASKWGKATTSFETQKMNLARMFRFDPDLDLNAFYYETEQDDKALEGELIGLGLDYNPKSKAFVSCIFEKTPSAYTTPPQQTLEIFLRNLVSETVVPVWRQTFAGSAARQRCDFLRLCDDGTVIAVLREEKNESPSGGELFIIRNQLIAHRYAIENYHFDPDDSLYCYEQGSFYCLSLDQRYIFGHVPRKNSSYQTVFRIELNTGARIEKKVEIRPICLIDLDGILILHTWAENEFAYDYALNPLDHTHLPNHLPRNLEVVTFQNSGKEHDHQPDPNPCQASFDLWNFLPGQTKWSEIASFEFKIWRTIKSAQVFRYQSVQTESGIRIAYISSNPDAELRIIELPSYKSAYYGPVFDQVMGFSFSNDGNALFLELGTYLFKWEFQLIQAR